MVIQKNMIHVKELMLIFASIENLILQLTQREYSMPLLILSQSSISQHIRHILEFYHEFLVGMQRKEIDFDLRKRSKLLEVDREYTLKFIASLQNQFQIGIEDFPLSVRVSTHEKEIRPTLNTSSFRELSYCNEHSIHHMAFIKIALTHSFPHITVPEGFGIAYSTQYASQFTSSN